MAQKNSGFTLIELTIVVVVMALLIAFFFQGANTARIYYDYDQTEATINEVTESLHAFAQRYGRYPCPADRTASYNSAEFGREIIDCQSRSDSAAMTVTPNTHGTNVLIGGLPVRSLNLPDEAMYDGFNAQLVYAVSVGHVSAADDYDTLINTPGAITMIAEDGLDPISETMQFAVLSLGADQRGAFGRDNGTEIELCAPNTQDAENCDGDAVFRNLHVMSLADGPQRFDDVVAFGHSRAWRPCRFDGAQYEHEQTLTVYSVEIGDCAASDEQQICLDGMRYLTDRSTLANEGLYQYNSCVEQPCCTCGRGCTSNGVRRNGSCAGQACRPPPSPPPAVNSGEGCNAPSVEQCQPWKAGEDGVTHH